MPLQQIDNLGEMPPAPNIIQGGMGVSISSWRLAGAVAENGGVGLVSGTGIGVKLARDLMDGDPGEHRRRSLADFPNQELVRRVMDKFFWANGRGSRPYADVPMLHARVGASDVTSLANVLGSYSEINLAAEFGEEVGMNLLTKVEEPNPGAIYGAMLTGKLRHLVMGAGVPTHVPDMLAKFARGLPIERPLDVVGGRDYVMKFNPTDYLGDETPDELMVPRFLPIVSAAVLARRMMDSANKPDGFVIEGPTAGGHNAPPRVKGKRLEDGQLEYGDRDKVRLEDFVKLGVPFYLAGGYGSPNGLSDALKAGASGVQVGTVFALASESGMDPVIRQGIIDMILSGKDVKVYTDGEASPTGYPFKVAELEGTLGGRDESGDRPVYQDRVRICNLGYLRERFWVKTPSGREILSYRCPSEPVEDYLKKRGIEAATVGRMCLCNGLFATTGQPQSYADGRVEPVVVTIGDDVNRVVRDIGRPEFSVSHVIRYLRGETQVA